MTTTPDAERLAQVDADLADLDRQLAAGELDVATVERLRYTYEVERDAVLSTAAVTGEPPPRARGRVVVGIAIVVIALVGAGFAVARTARDRNPGDLITGDLPTVNLADITNDEMEEVVAQFPDVPAMRLALADRYFTDGEFSSALGHYLIVLDQEPNSPQALANIGWMTYLSGESDIAARYVEQALSLEDRYPQAHFFLGAIRLFGLEDETGAIESFERVLEFDEVPAEIRAQAEELLLQARENS